MGSFSVWHWLIVALVVLLVFGTKKLRGAGRDLGEAVRGFKEGASAPATPADAEAARVQREKDAESRRG